MREKITRMRIQAHTDLEWYEKNIDRFKTKYDNKFVAFKNKTIIHSDRKYQDLLDDLEKKGVDASDMIIRFVSTIKKIL